METREEIERIVRDTQKRVRWPKRTILTQLGVSRTQQTMFRKTIQTARAPLRKSNQLTPQEIEIALAFCRSHRGINYYKLAYLMMDQNIAFLRPATLYALLKQHGFYDSKPAPSLAAKAYEDKPTYVHHTWHTDITYVKLFDIFYFLIVMLDGFSRYVLEWELLYDMRGDTVADFTQRVLDAYPDAVRRRVRIVSDNGSCYISAEYRLVLKQHGIASVRCAPYHPETNGKAEACIKIIRNEALRQYSPQCYQEALNVLRKHFHFYNHDRLHSGIGYLRPIDMFLGNDQQILIQREQGLQNAKNERALWNQNYNKTIITNPPKYDPLFCSV